MTAKYVVVRDGPYESPLVAPAETGITHRELAIAYVARNAIISAGFCDLQTGKVWGESSSLKVKSRPQDAALLSKYFGSPAPADDFNAGSIRFQTVPEGSLPPGCSGYMQDQGRIIARLEDSPS